MKIILIFLLFPFVSIEAQQEIKMSYPEPYPGWSMLASKIKYPELAKLAGVDNSYKVNLTIDSLGNLKNLNIENIGKYRDMDSIFTYEIYYALNSISWVVGRINDTPVKMDITMLIIFSQSTLIGLQTKPIMSTTYVDSEARIKIDSIKVSY